MGYGVDRMSSSHRGGVLRDRPDVARVHAMGDGDVIRDVTGERRAVIGALPLIDTKARGHTGLETLL